MHSKLWEREVDTFFIEGFVNSFIGIEINTPIMSLFTHTRTTTFTLLASSA